ncbi:MAG: tetratricopeptide repeat protein [Myxococcales bacterium]|nr:tetratricopeptide repeat protein [Myxococcales bacterium]HRC58214.1 tetratricopeptide repeat protein [Kofleriaceae bacterium]
MWSSYSARHAAQLIGLTESAVRSCIRDGLIGAPGEVPARLSFRDLAALRTAKALMDAGLPFSRVRKELAALARTLPEGRGIAELALEVRGGRVHVRGQVVTVGQLELPLLEELAAAEREAEPRGDVRALPRAVISEGPAAAPVVTADEWLARALALEDSEPAAAVEAYQRSLRLRPDCSEAWINLGRLHAESSNPEGARQCFRSALEVDPTDSTALYNLGVVAQDAGEEADAISLYRRALELDPALAEAHYNLATLYDQSGDARQAIRHINEYRKLTRG